MPRSLFAKLVLSVLFLVVARLQPGFGERDRKKLPVAFAVSHNDGSFGDVLDERYVDQSIRPQIGIQRVDVDVEAGRSQTDVLFIGAAPVDEVVGLVGATQTMKAVDLLPGHHRAKETGGDRIDQPIRSASGKG